MRVFIVVTMSRDLGLMVCKMISLSFNQRMNSIFIVAGDCFLESILPQQIIRNLIEAQLIGNTSVCTSTTG